MHTAQGLGLASAAVGAVGTGILYFSSYAVESVGAVGMFAEAVMPEAARIERDNARRRPWQRVGLALLGASFVLQGVAACWA